MAEQVIQVCDLDGRWGPGVEITHYVITTAEGTWETDLDDECASPLLDLLKRLPPKAFTPAGRRKGGRRHSFEDKIRPD